MSKHFTTTPTKTRTTRNSNKTTSFLPALNLTISRRYQAPYIPDINPYQPFLVHLEEMRCRVPRINKKPFIRQWGNIPLFEHTNYTQRKECLYLAKNLEGKMWDYQINRLRGFLYTWYFPKNNLQKLQKRNGLLDELNGNVIKLLIDSKRSSKKLQINGVLTRFPDWVLEIPELQEFWHNLEELNLANNALRSLPAALGKKCPNLKVLICDNNYLDSLPDSLAECAKLMHVSCEDNPSLSIPRKNRYG